MNDPFAIPRRPFPSFLITCALAILLMPWLAVGAEYTPRWESPFNGRNLDGWEPRGQAKWTIEDGVLVGQQNNGRVGDLLTVREWSDFELKVVYKVKWPANSGIWFRKPAKGLGYQMDILEKAHYGCASGSIWSRGFLARNLDESIENRNGWNTAVIRAEGDHITVTLNGKKVADIRDSKYAKGKIGFQVHGGEQYKHMKIMIKEAKILPLRSSEAAVSNEICLVCHLDFGREPLASKHLIRNVGCAQCHGESMAHAEDEEHLTKPDRTFKRTQVDGFCGLCHMPSKKPCTRKPSPKERGKVCTDCHGQHRIKEKPAARIAKRPARPVARPALVPAPRTEAEMEAGFQSPPTSCYPDLSVVAPRSTTPAQVALAAFRQLAEGRLPVKLTAADLTGSGAKPKDMLPLDRQPYASFVRGLALPIARATYLSAIGKPVAEKKDQDSFVLYPPDPEVLYLRLRSGQRDIYLVTNQSTHAYVGHVTFRSKGQPEVWDPDAAEIRPAYGFEETADATLMSLNMRPQACVFFVFREPAKSPFIRRAPGLTHVRFKRTGRRLDVTARAWMNGRYTVTLDDGRRQHVSVAGLPPVLLLDGPWQFATDEPYTREPSVVSIFRVAEAKENFYPTAPDFDDSAWDVVKPGDVFPFLLPKWDARWLTFRGNGAKRYFRKTFTLPEAPKKAMVSISVDNAYDLYVNGVKLGSDGDWKKAETYDVTAKLMKGKNAIAVLAKNVGGIAAILVQTTIALPSGKVATVVSDGTWKMAQKPPTGERKMAWTSVGFDDGKWGRPTVGRKPPVRPWGYIVGLPATPRTDARVWYRFDLPPGTAKLELPKTLKVAEIWVGGARVRSREATVDLSSVPKSHRSKAALLVGSGKPMPGPIRCHCAEGEIGLGSWTTQGYSRYVGKATYRRRFTLPEQVVGTRVVLDLGRVSAAARVRVNGTSVGARARMPYTFDLADRLHRGSNEIVVTVFSSLATEESVSSGLIGPVRLVPYRDIQVSPADAAE